jgi:hypothetical protein
MEKLQIAKEMIQDGATFNGTVYGKRSGNWTGFAVYLNGEYFKISDCHKSDNPAKEKAEIEAVLLNATVSTAAEPGEAPISRKTSNIPDSLFSGMVANGYTQQQIDEISNFHALCEGVD